MYKHIMVPVDLAHQDQQTRALTTAADLAKHYGAKITYVGVTGAAPGGVAHTPEEFADRLDAFGKGQAAAHGIEAETRPVVASDPVSDLDDKLMATVARLGADLVVMATHAPNIGDFIWPSNGGKIASHAAVSVFLVRPG